MSEEILFTGALFQVIRRSERYIVPNGTECYEVDISYEVVKRPPGVRAIIIRDKEILLNKEYRYELNDWDYRLPGGKVFDTQEQYQESESGCGLAGHIEKALAREVLEETGIEVRSCRLFDCAHNGFTVEWDLYYYVVDDFVRARDGRMETKDEYEYIHNCWLDYKTALKYCLEKKISEDRSAGILMRFLLRELRD